MTISAPNQAYAETRRAQHDAADPTTSAWVSANAGTGKTYVLTSRVLRLLLAGTPPERILALTYTKAAAAEMSKRVFDRLGGWVTMELEQLQASLADVLARAPDDAELARARTLFAHAIETPGGLKVQTIHAFCERLLQRFPLEAGVAPGFSILDDVSGAEILRAATDDVLLAATTKPDTPLARALLLAVAYAADDNFDTILRDALRNRDWLQAMSRLETVQIKPGELYRTALGLDPKATISAVEARQADVISDQDLARAITVLSAGKKTDAATATDLARAKSAPNQQQRIAALTDAFMTKEGTPRKKLATKAICDAEPALVDALATARDRLASLIDEKRTIAVVDATLALSLLANDVMQRYGEAKARRAALDFDDLIRHASSLLGRTTSGTAASVAEWVLYKLDGGLDHILVDEAQDTSRAQWGVVESLAEEFFAGSGARDIVRTIFAVGDEKQSIYGFQGAAPERFAAMGATFRKRAEQTGHTWRRVPLSMSFRTVAPVLQAVDRVFADPNRTPGVGAGTTPIHHIAHRAGQSGFVEIWPTEKPLEPTDVDAWSPLNDPTTPSPVSRLASRIADTIDGWLKSGEILNSENRPVRASDIIILVRRRQPFAPVMVAALKARGIAVAGADRLVLIDQIAVQDLIVLCDFLTLPEDDLALAVVLKSPLFGLDDDDLLAIAHGRKGQLWTALLKAAKTNLRLREAADTLRRWRAEADFTPPYEFLASILERDGGKFRTRLLERLGAEATDPLDELLNLALAYDSASPPSLQGFLTWLRASRQEVKRDMEQGRDEVRVMTVHGAKGLEAPIVFLPDTCSARSGGPAGGLVKAVDVQLPSAIPDLMLWPVKGTSRVSAVEAAKSTIAGRDAEERNRLLYVAMTRARDRLYIAGYQGKSAPKPECWYNLIDAGLSDRLVDIALPNGHHVRRLAAAQTAPHDAQRAEASQAMNALVRPEWWSRRPPPEPQLAMPLAPSRLAPLEADDDGEIKEPKRLPLAEPATPAASTIIDNKRFLRGTLTHALLEHLPGLPASGWEKAAAGYLKLRASELTAATRHSIAAEALAILGHEKFAPIFGPDSQAEVPIVAEIARPSGKGPPLRLTGQIDRLVRTGDRVLIIDYKTNRPPPREVLGVAEAYLYQLAAYRLALQRIFVGCHVSAAILWTDGARIMDIPDQLLDTYAAKLWTLDPASLDG